MIVIINYNDSFEQYRVHWLYRDKTTIVLPKGCSCLLDVISQLH